LPTGLGVPARQRRYILLAPLRCLSVTLRGPLSCRISIPDARRAPRHFAPHISPWSRHSEATADSLRNSTVLTILDFLPKRGLTKIRNYGLIISVRNVGAGRRRLREEAAGAGAEGGEKSPTGGVFGPVRRLSLRYSITPFPCQSGSASASTHPNEG